MSPLGFDRSPKRKAVDGLTTAGKASNPFDHRETSQIKEIATPICLPDVIKRGPAQRVLLCSIRQGIHPPPLALKVPGNREKKGAERNRNR